MKYLWAAYITFRVIMEADCRFGRNNCVLSQRVTLYEFAGMNFQKIIRIPESGQEHKVSTGIIFLIIVNCKL